MYNITNIEDYHNYVDESDKKHSEFLIEIKNETIDEKYYIEDYKNIPIMYVFKTNETFQLKN